MNITPPPHTHTQNACCVTIACGFQILDILFPTLSRWHKRYVACEL